MFMRMFFIKPAIVTSALLVAAVSFIGTAKAAINIANGAPVIGGSGDFVFGPFNSGDFPTSNVTNGANANPDNNVGSIHENFVDGSYWLGHDGQSTGHFVIDLGSASRIGLVELFNTRNGNARDRGTGNFKIYASNQVANGVFGMDLVSPVEIVSGALTPQTFLGGSPDFTPLVPDLFSVSDPTPFRYLRFNALSIGATAESGLPLAGVGLNEIRVFAAVPEASVLVVFGAVGGVGWLLRRRFQAALS